MSKQMSQLQFRLWNYFASNSISKQDTISQLAITLLMRKSVGGLFKGLTNKVFWKGSKFSVFQVANKNSMQYQDNHQLFLVLMMFLR